MPQIIRATAVINHKSGKPEDASHNVWHFASNTPLLQAERNALGDAVAGFYGNIKGRLSGAVASNTNAHRVELADIFEAVPGGPQTVTPVHTVRQFTLTPTGGNGPLPSQVAIALSFHGDYGTTQEEVGATRPRSRRRGRIFIGPLDRICVEADATTGEALVEAITREAILDAYDSMDAAVQAINLPSLAHSIYSRADGGAYNVTSVSVDNSFDIQRRRKVKRSTRMTREITPAAAQTGRNSTDVALAS